MYQKEIFIFQGTFSVYEKFKMVEEFVSECLEHPLPFILNDSASGQRMEELKESSLIGKVQKSSTRWRC